MDKYVFAANVNLGNRVNKNGEIINSFQIGLLDSSTPYRQDLFVRNIGRLSGFIQTPKQLTPPEQQFISKKEMKSDPLWQNKGNRGKLRGERKDKNKEYRKQYKEQRKEYLQGIQESEGSTNDEYRKLFSSENIGTAYSVKDGDVSQPYDTDTVEIKGAYKQFSYWSKLLGLRFGESDGTYIDENLYSVEDGNTGKHGIGNGIPNSTLGNYLSISESDKKPRLRIGNDSYLLLKRFLSYNESFPINKTVDGNNSFRYEELSAGVAPTFQKTERDGQTISNFKLGPEVKITTDLLEKTNNLFKGNKIKTMINRFYNNEDSETKVTSITQSAIDPEYGVSKGRNLLKKNPSLSDDNKSENPYDNPYCRVWTSLHQYNKYSEAIRHSDFGKSRFALTDGGFRPNEGAKRLSQESVLNNVGKPRIAPEGDFKDIRRCMFSIENLAWRDYYDKGPNKNKSLLHKSQIGLNGGRIMWFPPYGLTFSENVSAEWNSNGFIGRGENIYTYVNTDRSGTLSFILLIDHPSEVNIWKKKKLLDGTLISEGRDVVENDILRYFAGCGDEITDVDYNPNETNAEEINVEPDPITHTTEKVYNSIIFYPNYYSGMDDSTDDFIKYMSQGLGPELTGGYGYEMDEENGVSAGYTGEPQAGKFFYRIDKKYEHSILLDPKNYRNDKSDGINSGFEHIEDTTIKGIISDISLDDFLSLRELIESYSNNNTPFAQDIREATTVNIEPFGYASSDGHETQNQELSRNRRNTHIKLIKKIISKINPEINFTEESYGSSGNTDIIPIKMNETSINAIETKESRMSYTKLTILKNDKKNKNAKPGTTSNSVSVEVSSKPKTNKIYESKAVVESDDNFTFEDEYLYFDKLQEEDPAVFKKIREKVKYFDPAFHSITPEGFNARLTFLQQCTRQGPTNAASEVSENNRMSAGNLAFGRPPYCILRIGDFYNTKIAIDSLSIDYGDGSSPQWDLNPEGVGVQPMLAKVTLGFKFLGGSDLNGPIEELQNAVSFNYYSNTSIYDKRASIRKDKVETK